MRNFHKFSVATIVLLLFGCGGGGGSSSDGSSTSSAKSTGVFLDGPVINIGYRTETLEGVTNSLGEYKYLPGETVTFFIGALEFPAVTATGRITPLDVAGTQDTANSKVMNIIRLLQTLDQDGDPSNGITITDQAKSSATQVDFELSVANFAASSVVKNLILNAGLVAPVTELVSAADALAHFKEVLVDLGVLPVPVAFKYLLYDDFSDPGGNIDFTLWGTQAGATAASTLEIVGGSLIATAVKDAGVRADQGLWVANATNVSLTDFQAFRADFTILEATGNATNRAQILLGLPLENAGFFVDTGINFYASGEVKYFIEIFNNLGQPTTEVVSGTIAIVDPAVTHTLTIGWDGSNYNFQVDNIVPIIIPMSAETDISNANNWSWAAVRATVKDAGTGTTVANIDNVQRGGQSIYSIGDTGPAGGIVFYVTDGGLHGLEAAPVDQSAGAPWGCQGNLLFVNGTAIGTGAQNTADILAGCVDPGIAARLADNYSLNGFNDWFLPSQDELNELYLQRAVLGSFTTAYFWSSSEGFAVSAWGQDFNDGSVFNGDKNNITGVRAVRAF